jgi:hypothetical protein
MDAFAERSPLAHTHGKSPTPTLEQIADGLVETLIRNPRPGTMCDKLHIERLVRALHLHVYGTECDIAPALPL